MAEKNTIEKIVDYSNRRLFEGLLDYIANPVKTLKYMFSSEGLSDNAAFNFRLFQDEFLSKTIFPWIWLTYDEMKKKPILSVSKLGSIFDPGSSYYDDNNNNTDIFEKARAQKNFMKSLRSHEQRDYIGLSGVADGQNRYVSGNAYSFTKLIFGFLAIIHFIISVPLLIPGVRYFTNLALRLALLPITSGVYCVSRLAGVVFKSGASDHNFTKSLLMRITTAVAALTLVIKVPMITFSTFAANLGLGAGILGMSAATVGGLMVGGIAMVGFSLALYAAKSIAQSWNADKFKEANSELLQQYDLPFTNGISAPKYHGFPQDKSLSDKTNLSRELFPAEAKFSKTALRKGDSKVDRVTPTEVLLYYREAKKLAVGPSKNEVKLKRLIDSYQIRGL